MCLSFKQGIGLCQGEALELHVGSVLISITETLELWSKLITLAKDKGLV